MVIKYKHKNVYLVTKTNEKILIAKRLAVANTFFSRLFGLMGKKMFVKNCALLLSPCNSVHTFFMKFPIDVVYLDKDMNIVKVVKKMQPWKINFGGRRAKYVMELPAGTISGDKGRIVIEEQEMTNKGG